MAVLVAWKAATFANAISTQSPLSTSLVFGGGDSQRANVLVLGYGGGEHPGAYLTDSMLVLSLNRKDGKTTEISIPRDLWVQIPPDSGSYGKINSAYSYGRSQGGSKGGGEMAALKASQILGMPVNYWLTIDFQGFRQLVDALGGVDVDVEQAFSANYPANDDPNIDASWITVSFEAGRQHMNGEQAIRYARARYSDDPKEGTDFARSRRQQRLILAILRSAKSPVSWPRSFGVMDALSQNIYTNLSPLDLANLLRTLDLSNGRQIVLDDSNALESATAPDGEFILQPRNGDWDGLQRYVQGQLEEKKTE
ncbi:MAG: LCP family protein [Chloroflexi bacterium]|nr:LCP family protein [Chloroflexota bacterium]